VPIMIGGLLFSPTVNHTIVALQPETGTEVWKLIALDAMTGKLVPGFAKEGTLDLREGVTQRFPKAPYHMSSPGAIYRNLIITGAQDRSSRERRRSRRACDGRAGLGSKDRKPSLDVPHDSPSGRGGV
jgi:quinoprotein glucose dehydrogenase